MVGTIKFYFGSYTVTIVDRPVNFLREFNQIFGNDQIFVENAVLRSFNLTKRILSFCLAIYKLWKI